MVSLISSLHSLICRVINLSGLISLKIEVDPGTVMKIWVPKEARLAKPKSEKPAIVLAHPFNADSIFMWFPQVLALTATYAVYVPDFLFFGGSTTATAARSPEFQAACVAKCLGKLGVDKCTVVGLSYGGMVGFKMAEVYPSLVENLVVSSTVIALTRSLSEKIWRDLGVFSWKELLLPEDAQGVKRLFAIGTHKLPWLPNFIYEDALEALFCNRREKAELLEALVVNDEDYTPCDYPQRIHFIWGDNEKIFDLELAQTMKEEIGDKATLKWIKNAGHLVQLERPFAYNRELKRILATFYPNSKKN